MKAGGEAFAFTCPLIKKRWRKGGKTECGNVWNGSVYHLPVLPVLALNASMQIAEGWIKIFTFLEKTVIEELLARHAANPGARGAHKNAGQRSNQFCSW